MSTITRVDCSGESQIARYALARTNKFRAVQNDLTQVTLSTHAMKKRATRGKSRLVKCLNDFLKRNVCFYFSFRNLKGTVTEIIISPIIFANRASRLHLSASILSNGMATWRLDLSCIAADITDISLPKLFCCDGNNSSLLRVWMIRIFVRHECFSRSYIPCSNGKTTGISLRTT